MVWGSVRRRWVGVTRGRQVTRGMPRGRQVTRGRQIGLTVYLMDMGLYTHALEAGHVRFSFLRETQRNILCRKAQMHVPTPLAYTRVD